MNRHRLEVLSKFLRTLPVKKFDIETWRSDCGTTACAIGWACTIPEFQEAGLEIDEPYEMPSFMGAFHYPAVAKFFDIKTEMSKILFSPVFYAANPTPSDVADKIDTLLAGGAI